MLKQGTIQVKSFAFVFISLVQNLSII